ncbi:CKS-domain-containing protein [Heliocybe sulcata]|uniref:Cyclin-dependent kinases regulatory subunit n=1 Tax=Heliocybe sulcata TaxID=5364 RepID=A0A5C3NA03_9AGAM|nr:CKS-domain-containing protein [Heliocybe sulcata]
MAAQIEGNAKPGKKPTIEDMIDKIHYSDRYSDDEYEYRHVILPKPFLRYLPKEYFNKDDSGTLRLLNEEEWRGIGIQQSLGWVHYEVHAPEPHVLLFRRAKYLSRKEGQLALQKNVSAPGRKDIRRK